MDKIQSEDDYFDVITEHSDITRFSYEHYYFNIINIDDKKQLILVYYVVNQKLCCVFTKSDLLF